MLLQPHKFVVEAKENKADQLAVEAAVDDLIQIAKKE
jgi:hypothetical protein